MKTLLCFSLMAASASAYEVTGFQTFTDFGYTKITLLKDGTNEKGSSINYSGPRLDKQWKQFSFAFIPESDGVVGIRFGPTGRGDIPFEYEAISVNGVPVDEKTWFFYPPSQEGMKKGSLVSEPGKPPRIKVYMMHGAVQHIKVKKGERVEISMRGRSDSFLDALEGRLEEVQKNLSEAIRISPLAKGNTTARTLADSLNTLVALSGEKLNISVAPLDSGDITLEVLKAKTSELIAAYEAEKARTANETTPCLYDQPKEREALRQALYPLIQRSSKVQTASLLEFMLKS